MAGAVDVLFENEKILQRKALQIHRHNDFCSFSYVIVIKHWKFNSTLKNQNDFMKQCIKWR